MSNAENFPSLSPGHPFASRKTIGTIQNEQGQIVKLDAANFGIQPSSTGTVLLPVNLPEEFQQDGLNITFSGAIKEVNPNEMMAGQPFVLSAICK